MTTGMHALSNKPIAVSVGRAAELVGVSKATIRSFQKSGRLRVARLGRRVVVPMSALEQLVRESMAACLVIPLFLKNKTEILIRKLCCDASSKFRVYRMQTSKLPFYVLLSQFRKPDALIEVEHCHA